MWPILILAGLAILAIGCSGRNVIYPGDGTRIALDLDGPLLAAFHDDVIADVQKAIAIWTPAGPCFQIGGTADVRIPVHLGVQGPCGTDAEGCYDPATGEIYSVAGTGPNGTLAFTLAHELGHAIGLQHVSAGIMQAGGGDYSTLQPDDLIEYERVWRRAPAPSVCGLDSLGRVTSKGDNDVVV